jgi:hypothetical protein
MPTMTATGNLSARLRLAKGRRDEVVEVSDTPTREPDAPRQWHGEGDRCTWSVMPGQRCNRAAVVGDPLCRNHLAMMGTR